MGRWEDFYRRTQPTSTPTPPATPTQSPSQPTQSTQQTLPAGEDGTWYRFYHPTPSPTLPPPSTRPPAYLWSDLYHAIDTQFTRPEAFTQPQQPPSPDADPSLWEEWFNARWYQYSPYRPPSRPVSVPTPVVPQPPSSVVLDPNANLTTMGQISQLLQQDNGNLLETVGKYLAIGGRVLNLPFEFARQIIGFSQPYWDAESLVQNLGDREMAEAAASRPDIFQSITGLLQLYNPVVPGIGRIGFENTGDVYRHLKKELDAHPDTPVSEVIAKVISDRWKEAGGFRYSMLTQPEAAVKYWQLRNYTKLRERYGDSFVIRDRHGRPLEVRDYSPIEAGLIVEDPVVETASAFILDPLNLIPSSWIEGAAKVLGELPGISHIFKGVGKVTEAASELWKKVPLGAWASELTGEVKARQAAHSVGQTINYIATQNPSINVVKVFRGDAEEIARLPTVVADNLLHAVQYLHKDDIAKVESLLAKGGDIYDAGIALAKAAEDNALKAATALNKKVWGPAAEAVANIGRNPILRWLGNAQVTWAAHVLSSRPAWLIRNLTDAYLRFAIEGINPFDDVAKRVRNHVSLYGDLPLSVVASREVVDSMLAGESTAKAFWKGFVRNVDKMPMFGFEKLNRLNPVVWFQAGVRGAAETWETVNGLRVFFSAYDKFLNRNLTKALTAIDAPLPAQAKSLFTQMVLSASEKGIEEVRRLKEALAGSVDVNGNLRLASFSFDPQLSPNIPQEMADRVVQKLKTLSSQPVVSVKQFNDIFKAEYDTLQSLVEKKVAEEVAKRTESLPLPQPQNLYQKIIKGKWEATKGNAFDIFDELGGMLEGMRVRRELYWEKVRQQVDQVTAEGKTLRAAEKAKLWRNAFKKTIADGREFLRQQQKVILTLDEKMTKANNGIPVWTKAMVNDYLDAAKKLVDLMEEHYKIEMAGGRTITDWVSYQSSRAAWAGQVQAQKMVVEAMRDNMAQAIRNSSLSGQLGPRPTYAWRLAQAEIDKIRWSAMSPLRPIYEELLGWQRSLRRQSFRPDVTLQGVDATALGQYLDEAVGVVDRAVADAVKYATSERNRVMYDYVTTTNLQRLIGKVFPFWRYPMNNIPYWAETFLRHPSLLSGLAYYTRVVPQQNVGLPSRFKYSVPIDELSPLVSALTGVPSRFFFNPLVFFSIAGQLPISVYQQKRVEEMFTDAEQPGLGKFLEIAQSFGGSMTPIVDYLLGFAGFLGDDWFPQDLSPYSSLVEYISRQTGVLTSKDKYGHTIGFNPDLWFRRNVVSIFTTQFGWSKERLDRTPMGYWLLGREARRELMRFALENNVKDRKFWELLREVDEQTATDTELRRQAMSGLLGHFTSLYGQQLTEEEMQERILRDLKRQIKAEYGGPFGATYKDALRAFYEEYPAMRAIEYYYDRFGWATRPEAVLENIAEADRRMEMDKVYDEYNNQLRALLKKGYDAQEVRILRSLRNAKLSAIEDKYRGMFPDIERAFIPFGDTPEEMEMRTRRDLLSRVVETAYPKREDYLLPDGSTDWDRYNTAKAYFFDHMWDIANKTAEMGEIRRQMSNMGLDKETQDNILRPFFTEESLRKYWAENHTPIDALLVVYEDFYLDSASQYYTDKLKPELDAIAADEKMSPSEKAEARSRLWGVFDQLFGEVEASRLIERVLAAYPNQRWTPLRLAAEYEGIVLPDVRAVWAQNDKPEKRITAELWEEYNRLGDLSRRRVRESLGDKFKKYFVDKETRDYSQFSLEELGTYLNAIQLSAGRPLTDWVEWQQKYTLEKKLALGEGARRNAAKLLVPEVVSLRSGEDAAVFVGNLSEEDVGRLMKAWDGMDEKQKELSNILHPGLTETMDRIRPFYRTEMTDKDWDVFRALTGTLSRAAGFYPVPSDKVTEVKDTGLPELRLATPEEEKAYDRARGLNEKLWVAREADDWETIKAIEEDKDWLTYFGSMPKSMFWLTLNNMAPGWRSKDARELPEVARILEADSRDDLGVDEYEKAVAALKQWLDKHPEALEGSKDEWHQARMEYRQYAKLRDENPDNPDVYRGYWNSHPLLQKYYATLPTRDSAYRARYSVAYRQSYGGGGGSVYGGSFNFNTWKGLEEAFGALTGRIVGELIAYFGINKLPLTDATRTFLMTVYAQSGSNLSFEDWLKFVLAMWKRYSGRTPIRPLVFYPRTVYPRPIPGFTTVRKQISR